MKIALIGYGKMGRFIEKIAQERGHEIVSIIDVKNPEDFESSAFKSADVAIEFTRPESALSNYRKAFQAGVPVVSGTTGWTEHMETIRQEVENNHRTFLWASNFSLGVNLFFALNKQLAKMMNDYSMYNVDMCEVHHTEKKDAPSGTAISLAKDVIQNLDRKDSWQLGNQHESSQLGIQALREPGVPGTHTIHYESPVDEITITHKAKSREGFALGAVLAAEYASQHTGWLTMNDVLHI
jgi:4-hydroxy-tetrahydrodipicolinate reductase